MIRIRCLLGLILLILLLTACGPRAPKSDAAPPASIRFRDVTQAAGLNFNRINGAFGQRWMPETMGGGGAFLDYDNDGFLDILLVNGDWWPGHPLPGARPTLGSKSPNKRPFQPFPSSQKRK